MINNGVKKIYLFPIFFQITCKSNSKNNVQAQRKIMISELRKAKRFDDYLPIRIVAWNKASGRIVAGPFSGRIINISSTGACLLVTQVMDSSYHVFYSTRDDDALSLQLTITLPPDIKNFQISAQPMWLDRFQQDKIRAFKMGVDFLPDEQEEMDLLMEAMAKQQKQRQSWWLSHTLRAARALSVYLFSGR